MPISFSRRFACDGCELPMGAERSARHSIYIPYIAECSFTFSIVELKVLYVHVARECFTQTKPKIKLKKRTSFYFIFQMVFFCFFFASFIPFVLLLLAPVLLLLLSSSDIQCRIFTIACVIAHRLEWNGSTFAHSHLRWKNM